MAEDSLTMQRVLQMTFLGNDYLLRFAATADEALAQARQGPPDLLVADVTLPGNDGYALCAAFRADAALAHVPLILLAGKTFVDEARIRSLGVDGHVVKPFDTQHLIDRVEAVLAKQVPTASPPAQDVARMDTLPLPTPASSRAVPLPPATIPAPPVVESDFVIEIDAEPAAPEEKTLPPVFEAVSPFPPPVFPPRTPPPTPAIALPPAPAPPPSPAAPTQAALSQTSREIIERIVWEVVPDLAETIIRQELERLTASRAREK